MPSINLNGCNIVYEEMGSGPPLAMTPGGRNDRNPLRELAEWLAEDFRVIIYDRRNTGASDFVISRGESEFHIWAEDLHEMLLRLDASPAYVGGASAGCRTSLHLAIEHPESVRGLFLWNIPDFSTAAVAEAAETWYGKPAEMAREGGMPAVVTLPYFAERIQLNPSNRDRSAGYWSNA